MKNLNYLLQFQPDIAREAFKVRSGMTDIRKKIIQTNAFVTSVQCPN